MSWIKKGLFRLTLFLLRGSGYGRIPQSEVDKFVSHLVTQAPKWAILHLAISESWDILALSRAGHESYQIYLPLGGKPKRWFDDASEKLPKRDIKLRIDVRRRGLIEQYLIVFEPKENVATITNILKVILQQLLHVDNDHKVGIYYTGGFDQLSHAHDGNSEV